MQPKVITFVDKPKELAQLKQASLEEVKERLRPIKESLPIYLEKKVLVDAVKKNKCLIVVGETGSGKTTQLPQYLYEAGFAYRGAIACTQPRRVAAITVAQRVAQEMGVELSKLVGYTVRFDDKTSKDTKIKYLTDGMLLRELQIDPMLKRYSVVLLDEAHERTMNTDVLFGLLKQLQRTHRPDLRIIAMSATLDAEKFSTYFDNAPVALVAGRTHPVDIYYTETPQSDFVEASVITALQLHQDKPMDGDILIFLPGSEEIENAKEAIDTRSIALSPDAPGVHTVVLYSQLAPEIQLLAFEPAPQGKRKIVIATNIAETSVTLSGIKYVVDAGMAKVKKFADFSSIQQLALQPISRAEAWQRSGRSGRECAGECYRLYTEDAFMKMNPTVVPEIMRVPLATIVLHLLSLNVKDVTQFDFIDKPQKRLIREAIGTLLVLGAIGEDGNVTSLGLDMARLPLEPALAKVLLASANPPDDLFSPCSSEIVSLISALTVDHLFLDMSRSKGDAARRAKLAHSKFISQYGDMITSLEVVTKYLQVHPHRRLQWAKDHFINTRNIETVVKVREQLVEELTGMGLSVVSCRSMADSSVAKAAMSVDAFVTPSSTSSASSSNGMTLGDDGDVEGGVEMMMTHGDTNPLDHVRKCLVTGLFSNAAKRQQDGSYKTADNTVVHVHPSSVLQSYRALMNQSTWMKQNAFMKNQAQAAINGSVIPATSQNNPTPLGGGQNSNSMNDMSGTSPFGPHPFDCLLFSELIHTTKYYMRQVIVVEFAWLAELVPKLTDLHSISTHRKGQGVILPAYGGYDPRSAMDEKIKTKPLPQQTKQQQQQQQQQQQTKQQQYSNKHENKLIGGRPSSSPSSSSTSSSSSLKAMFQQQALDRSVSGASARVQFSVTPSANRSPWKGNDNNNRSYNHTNNHRPNSSPSSPSPLGKRTYSNSVGEKPNNSPYHKNNHNNNNRNNNNYSNDESKAKRFKPNG